MARIVLETATRTITGNIRIPNGISGDITSQASAGVSIQWGSWNFSFISQNGFGYGWGPGGPAYLHASVIGPGAGTHIDFTDLPNEGRGVDGAYVTGSFSITGEAELCLYIEGRYVADIDDPIPDDYYPTYGGAPTYGEYPETNAKLIWEYTTPPKTATISCAGRSASVTAPFGSYADNIHVNGGVTDDSFFDSGGCTVDVSWDGIPVEGDSGWKEFYGRHDGLSGNPEELGAKIACGVGRFSVMNRGWIRQSTLMATIFSCSATMFVPRIAELQLDAMAFDQPHPHACQWTVLDKWIHRDGDNIIDPPLPHYTTLTGQAVSLPIRQNKMGVYAPENTNKSITRTEQSTNWHPAHGVLGTTYFDFIHYEDDTGPVQYWIAPPPGEDSKDWRVGIRGRSFNSLKLNHAESLSVAVPTFDDDGLGTWALPKLMEGYRFLEVGGDCEGIRINGKRWALTEENRVADLCFPDNTTSKTDATHTRYPVEYDHNDRSTIEAPLWGISQAKSIQKIDGDISSLTLKRKEFAQTHWLAPLGDWQEWHSPDQVDDWEVEWDLLRGGIGDVDGRQSLELYHTLRRIDHAPGRRYTTDYFHQSMSAVGGQAVFMPGYTLTEASSFPDAYHTNDLAAYCAAQGYVREGEDWLPTFGTGSGEWIKAQGLFDSIEWHGLCGDVFGVGLGDEKVLGLIGRKVFRSAAYGAAMNAGTGKVAEPFESGDALVKGSDKPTFAELINEEPSETIGYYGFHDGEAFGPTESDPNKWGLVRFDYIGGEEPYSSPLVTVGSVPRRIERVAFALPELTSKGSISYCVAQNGRHYTAYVNDENKAVIGHSSNSDHTAMEFVETEIYCTSVCVRVTKHTKQKLALAYADGEDIKVVQTANDGESFTVPITITSDGDYPAMVLADNGAKAFYWLEDTGSSFTLKGQIRNALDAIVTDTFTILEDIEEGGLAADESYGSQGLYRITLFYKQDGGLQSLVSSNGVDFS